MFTTALSVCLNHGVLYTRCYCVGVHVLIVAVVRSSAHDNGIRYVGLLLVLWMTLCFGQEWKSE